MDGDVKMEIIEFPRGSSPVDLAEGFSELADAGRVKWAIMVICESADNSLRYEWSRLPNNLSAIGAIECLKQRLMEE